MEIRKKVRKSPAFSAAAQREKCFKKSHEKGKAAIEILSEIEYNGLHAGTDFPAERI
ncbi:MAG: hypothetical protein LUH51_05020 [Firmicutes bacterium]|nr:hypothetical protein [Bacillota bacterium]